MARQASERNASAMRQLYDRYIGYMTTAVARYISDEDDRKDVLQDSFIKIFDSLGRFTYRGEGSLRAWMTRITINEALQRLRREKRYDLFSPIEELQDDVEEPEDLDSLPPEVLLEMIASLPEGYRTVLNLFVFEDKSHKEIAQLLGIKENSSASQYHRAKALLAQKINAYKAQEP